MQMRFYCRAIIRETWYMYNCICLMNIFDWDFIVNDLTYLTNEKWSELLAFYPLSSLPYVHFLLLSRCEKDCICNLNPMQTFRLPWAQFTHLHIYIFWCALFSTCKDLTELLRSGRSERCNQSQFQMFIIGVSQIWCLFEIREANKKPR
jgi:hypothetical protein